METLVRTQAEVHNPQSAILDMPMPMPEPAVEKADVPMPMPEPAQEKADACSQPFAAGSKPHTFYKCLLNQHAQKLRQPIPTYQTRNEGSEHLPKFRSTVWIDGMCYTSSNTFQQRKMAEMDVSKMAYFAIMQQSKDEALNFIREDKLHCKSILMEYAAKMNMERPVYKTTKLEAMVPVFHTSVTFNGVTYSGENGKSKKEAEQLAARSVILKYLDSQAVNDVSELIKCKFRQFAELNKVQGVHVQNDTTVASAQTGIHNEPNVKSGLVQVTTVQPSCPLTQPAIPGVSLDAVTPVVPVVTQPTIPAVSVEAICPTDQKAPIEAITPVPVVTELADDKASAETIIPVVSVVTQPADLKISTEAIVPAVPVVTQVVDEKVSNEAIITPLVSQAPDFMPLIVGSSEKKRNRKNKRNAQKKMRLDAKMPMTNVPMSEVQPSSSQ